MTRLKAAICCVAVTLACASVALAVPPERPYVVVPIAPATGEAANAARLPGDCNVDGVVDVRDVFCLLNFLFAGSRAPFGPTDMNGDGLPNAADVFYLIAALFGGGPPPMPDTTPPEIPLTDPYAQAPGVPTNAPYVIEFSEPMDASTLIGTNLPIRDLTTEAVLDGTWEVDKQARIATFRASAPFSPGRSYALAPVFAAITDQAGNPLEIPWYATGGLIAFTVGFNRDLTSPFVEQTFPVAGSKGLPTNVVFSLKFSETVADIGLTASFSANGLGAISATQYGTSRLVTLSFPPLTPHTDYVLRASGVSDLAGNTMDPYELRFTTGAGPDTTPLIADYTPGRRDERVPRDVRPYGRFSKPVDPLSFSAALVQTIDRDIPQSATVTLAPDLMSVLIEPHAPLQPTSFHRIKVSARDWSKNRTPPGGQAGEFYTGSDFSAPLRFDQWTPPTGTADVPANATISIRAGGSLHKASLDSAVKLLAGGMPLAATVTSVGNEIKIRPAVPLPPSTEFAIAIDGLIDGTGRLYPQFRSTFATAAASESDLTPPYVVSTSPAHGSVDVDPAAPVEVRFSELLDPLSVGATAVNLYVAVSSPYGRTDVPQLVTYRVNGSIVTLTPVVPLPPATEVRIEVSGYMSPKDLAGNSRSTASSIATFRTAGARDTTPPFVVSFERVDSDTVHVRFSEPVHELSSQDVARFYNAGRRAEPTIYPVKYGLEANVEGFRWPGPVTLVLSSGLADLAGNRLPQHALHFVEPEWARAGIPYIFSMRPAVGASEVPLATPVTVFATAGLIEKM
jgi:large repetitive protein